MVKGKGPVYRLKRADKARMIEAVLAAHLGEIPAGKRILDIGCGNGDISQYLSRWNEQYGVDLDDKRKSENHAFYFRTIVDEHLPFADNHFDIAISNHVIEHVGNQELHLAEMRRVLRPTGIAYIATPNRSSPIMQGHKGNTSVLRYREMGELFRTAGFKLTEYSIDVLKSPDRFHGDIRQVYWIPQRVLRLLRRFFPSHIFIITPIQ